MVSELKTFGILFIGMAIGSTSPFAILGVVIFMAIASVFLFLDLYLEIKNRRLK